jgi:outer membrane protein assembly factor BamA
MGGVHARFYLDFRDRQVFATRGLQLLVENRSYVTLDGASGNFGLAETYVKYFGTAKILIPITLVLKLGGSKNYGQRIPFYRYVHLGQFSNLRGYKRNRFTGDAAAYLNSELRFHLGKVRNLFLPFETGLIGFFDAGRVWLKGNADSRWHRGYGAGFYISPLTRDYLFTLMFESSPEEKLLFRFGVGFMLDN